jgi:hypothetical protein
MAAFLAIQQSSVSIFSPFGEGETVRLKRTERDFPSPLMEKMKSLS